MTTNAIAYLKSLEDQRHNRAVEGETSRANRAQEAQKSAELRETSRSNKVREDNERTRNAYSLINTMTQAQTADKDRGSRERLSQLDRESRETIASKDRASKEGISQLDRTSKENIAHADRASRELIAGQQNATSMHNALVAADASRYGANLNRLNLSDSLQQAMNIYNLDNYGTTSPFMQPQKNVPRDLRWNEPQQPLNYRLKDIQLYQGASGIFKDIMSPVGTLMRGAASFIK